MHGDLLFPRETQDRAMWDVQVGVVMALAPHLVFSPRSWHTLPM